MKSNSDFQNINKIASRNKKLGARNKTTAQIQPNIYQHSENTIKKIQRFLQYLT